MILNYRAVIFDWDGTLVDTCGLVLDAHNHVRSYMGLKLWVMDDFLGRASKSAREYYPEVYGARAEEAMKLLYEYVDANHLTYLKAMPHAVKLLKMLTAHNLPIGIVSNKRHETLQTEVKAMGWADYFIAIVGAGIAEKDKPSPAPLFMAMDKIDTSLEPKDILYIGDTETDLLCAKNASCPVVFVQSNRPRPDLVELYDPIIVCPDLPTLIPLLEGGSGINKTF